MEPRLPAGSPGPARGARPDAWAVIVAGGNGTRFGRRKQWVALGGRPVIAWSFDAARAVCAGVVVVVPATDEAGGPGPDELEGVRELLDRADAVVTGGVARSDSVRAGLAAVAADARFVVVHDAARPLAGVALWDEVLRAVEDGADAAVPVVAVTDTITEVDGGGAMRTLDRTRLRAVQTPQAFRADALRRAHRDGPQATDDASLVEALGGRVVAVDGHVTNTKITAPSDLAVAGALLGAVPVTSAASGPTDR